MSATAEHGSPGAAPRLVGHCYTKARRFPLVIGKLPGGGRIPGGPYSLHQIGAMVVAAVVLKQTSPLWAHFGPLNLVVFVAVPYGLAYALRHARIDGRNPFWAATGWLAYRSAPRAGRLRGRPIRPVRKHRQAGRFRFGPVPPSLRERSLWERGLRDRSVHDRSLTDRSVHDRSLTDRSVHERSLTDRRGAGTPRVRTAKPPRPRPRGPVDAVRTRPDPALGPTQLERLIARTKE